MDTHRGISLETRADDSAGLFVWRAGETVLIGAREADRWVLARGWREGDRLTDVRRWRFVAPELFCRQVGRLVADAGVRDHDARDAARAWAGLAG